jgi:hypothetical protein
LRTFLLGGGSEDDVARIRQLLSEHDVVAGYGGELTRLTEQGREAAEEQLASVAAGLLDLDLGDLLIYGKWSSWVPSGSPRPTIPPLTCWSTR